ncbi:hypothetical protein CEN45_22005 [Fischerella thermalis CCMEE 5198]|jgi:hypothetical protein|nr:hypothetical protein CI594_11355 [Fischerella thermalis CCMEE 5196]PMB17567.1 hypothetical protein CEN45_22005 [Fischerella thermalis CCMEE 5198]PMB50175.1 hypothetical protein CEN39_19245 [Fischerella thermalis CCMEE 5201]
MLGWWLSLIVMEKRRDVTSPLTPPLGGEFSPFPTREGKFDRWIRERAIAILEQALHCSR